ncbi:unnamed protein product [Menidia menidia]|uniref:(Atlantic silverside) hypothetical protein n=1 Tax=Menidia menidia TaxID=238744 RepID=A0A8S4BCG1_9TELE|nr:unnamed protein product [Menidia menidia]
MNSVTCNFPEEVDANEESLNQRILVFRHGGQFGPQAQGGAARAHLQQEEDPGEGRQDQGTAENRHHDRQLSGRSPAEARGFLSSSSSSSSSCAAGICCCCWLLHLLLGSAAPQPPRERGFPLDLVLVQTGSEYQAAVGRAGQAVCGPRAGAGEAGWAAGQAGLHGGQVHPVLQGEVEQLQPGGEAQGTQLHTTLEEEGEAGAALWKECSVRPAHSSRGVVDDQKALQTIGCGNEISPIQICWASKVLQLLLEGRGKSGEDGLMTLGPVPHRMRVN